MNYNILSYSIYILVTFYVTIFVGKYCFIHGGTYLENIIHEHPEKVKSINRILLTGFYLINLGYAALMLNGWPKINDIIQSFLVVIIRIGRILFILGAMHYNNMLLTYILSKKINKHNLLNH